MVESNIYLPNVFRERDENSAPATLSTSDGSGKRLDDYGRADSRGSVGVRSHPKRFGRKTVVATPSHTGRDQREPGDRETEWAAKMPKSMPEKNLLGRVHGQG